MDEARPRRMVNPPPGLEDHLTRREVAALLGFASEYKVRQLERRGRLSAVRGAMGTAFYRRADVLVLKVELERRSALTAAGPPTEVSDAELLALLARPGAAAPDLVTEAGISIERAERVFAFWRQHGDAKGLRSLPAMGTGPSREATVVTSGATIALPPDLFATAAAAVHEDVPPSVALGSASRAPGASASTLEAAGPGDSGRPTVALDRRSRRRQSRAELLAQLRDPRPAIRAAAFAALRD